MSSLSALAGRSTTSPAAMRLISSAGSLLIDMLRVLTQSETAGEALILRENSDDIQRSGNNRNLNALDDRGVSHKSIERRGSNVLESLVQVDVARHGDRPWDRQHARLRPRPRNRPQ